MLTQDKIAATLVQELADSKEFDAGQLLLIRERILQGVVAGYDLGRTHNPKEKPVLQMDEYGNTIGEFSSAYEAAKRVPGTHAKLINAVCRGKRHRHGGWGWRYKNISEYQ